MIIIKHKILPFVLESSLDHYLQKGWGNGYIAISSNHPCYCLSNGEIYRMFPSIEVHGGITYNGYLQKMFWQRINPKYKIPNNPKLWILGFDTAHYNSTKEDWPDEKSVLSEAIKFKKQLEIL